MQVTVHESAPEASRVYQVLHGRGAGQTLARYPCNTATPALPMPSLDAVAGTPVAAGIHHDDLQHSTTFIPSSTPWFSRRVRQRPAYLRGATHARVSTGCAAASPVCIGRQHQSTSTDTTSQPTPQQSAGASCDAVRSQRVCFTHDGVRASRNTAVVFAGAAAADGAACTNHATSSDTTTFATKPSTPRFCADAESVCGVCGSTHHEECRCFIAQGVPANVRMRADKVVEICRLHDLYNEGAFDWRTTPTSLEWMLRLRAKRAASASFEPTLDPKPAGLEPHHPRATSYSYHDLPTEMLHGPDWSIAASNGCDCEECGPNPMAEPYTPRATSLDGDGGGSDDDEGYSSALEDEDGGVHVDLRSELPPGARIPPQRITPAVARARWRGKLDLGVRMPGKR